MDHRRLKKFTQFLLKWPKMAKISQKFQNDQNDQNVQSGQKTAKFYQTLPEYSPHNSI